MTIKIDWLESADRFHYDRVSSRIKKYFKRGVKRLLLAGYSLTYFTTWAGGYLQGMVAYK